MKFIKKSIIILSTFLITLSLTACGEKVDTEALQNYSNDIASKVITAMDKKDYNKIESYFSDEMKKTFSKETFDEQATLISNTLGAYKSHEFFKGETKDGYVRALYKANFAKENNVLISVVYKENDENHKVEGILYQSKGLQKAAKELKKENKK
ncbi:DUF3887 domain-containing protein [Clostridium ihumii]